MAHRRLSIIIPSRLQGMSILPNLSRFSRFVNKDPKIHMQSFVDIFIISLVTNHGYYLI